MRLAIVGPGRWGRILVEAVQGISETVTFTHAVARSPAKAAAWCAAQDLSLSDDLSAALADPDIDGIVLATPHSQHKDQLIQVAKAGKALFCEKPAALTRTSVEAAIEVIKGVGVVFCGRPQPPLPARNWADESDDRGWRSGQDPACRRQHEQPCRLW